MDRISKSSYVSIGVVMGLVWITWFGSSAITKLETTMLFNQNAIEESVKQESYDIQMEHFNATLIRLEGKLDKSLEEEENEKK